MPARHATLRVSVTNGTGTGTVVGTAVGGFGVYDYFMVDANVVNSGSGTVDLYLQRASTYGGTTTWLDWMHFPQLTVGIGRKYYTAPPQPANGIVAVGANGSPALAVNTAVGGHPGKQIRAVAVTAAPNPATAQEQVFDITCWRESE